MIMYGGNRLCGKTQLPPEPAGAKFMTNCHNMTATTQSKNQQ